MNMEKIDQELIDVISAIKRAGGMAQIDRSAPDETKRALIEMVLQCPDCRAAMAKA